MSSKELSRRAAAEISFDGTDITSSIRPYFLSMTYTDNEEDETDDLQIRLQDREGLWMCKWLNDAVQAAASTAVAASESGAKSYTVTAKSGLNVRSGPGTGNSKLGALVYGAEVQVSKVENGWAVIDYGGKTAYVSANYIKENGGGSSEETSRTTGLKIQAVIARQNWNGTGKDDVLDCGMFELDSIDASGPPATVTIKATSLPFTAQIRQTAKSKGWESYTLSGIAQEMAAANGMTCMYLSDADPFYQRVEQFKVSDIAFLSQLCHDAGISLKATNKILVLFDQASYEAQPGIFNIKRGGGGYTKYKLDIGTADTQYQSCRVSYVSPTNGKCISGTAYVEDYKADSENNQQLEITAKVSNAAEAKALAEKHLRLHNKYQRTVSFTLPGNPAYVAGMTFTVEGWGAWDGKYIIKQAAHTVGNSGYTVQIKGRRVLEGY